MMIMMMMMMTTTIISMLVTKCMYQILTKKLHQASAGLLFEFCVLKWRWMKHHDCLISLLYEYVTLRQTRSIARCYAAIFLEITETWNVYDVIPQKDEESTSKIDCHYV
jgi:hypothetical protein